MYSNDQLDHIVQPEGLAKKTSSGFVYYYAKKDHVGSVRVLCHEADGKMKSVQSNDYYPLGLTFFSANTDLNRYLFSGKELQDQTVGGKQLTLYDFGARNYDPTLGRWFNPDPAMQFTNPYVYCANNPIMFVDPNGLLASPIYDGKGRFLGTDEEGLKGDPIFMDDDDFKQGMDHGTATELNEGYAYLEDRDAVYTFLQHYQNLPNRPDYDGIVTFDEAIDHYHYGNGEPLYVDISKINFKSSSLSVDDFNSKGGTDLSVNFFMVDTHPFNRNILWYSGETNLAAVYGSLSLHLESPDGTVTLNTFDYYNGGFDRFDFNFADRIIANSLRSGGNPTPYNFYGYGKGRIHVSSPVMRAMSYINY